MPLTETIRIVSVWPSIGTAPGSVFRELLLLATIGAARIGSDARSADSFASLSTALLWGFVLWALTWRNSTLPARRFSRTSSCQRSGLSTGSPSDFTPARPRPRVFGRVHMVDDVQRVRVDDDLRVGAPRHR